MPDRAHPTEPSPPPTRPPTKRTLARINKALARAADLWADAYPAGIDADTVDWLDAAVAALREARARQAAAAQGPPPSLLAEFGAVDPPPGPSPAAEAKELVGKWWETQDPRPQQPFVAVVKVVRKALESGWTAEEVRAALAEVPVVSGGALDLWRRRRAGRGAAPVPPPSRRVMTDRDDSGGRWTPPGRRANP